MATSVAVKAVIFLTFIAFSSARQFPDFLDALSQMQLSKYSREDVAGVLSALHYHQWLLQTIDSNATLQEQLVSVMSSRCIYELSVWMMSLKRLEMWAIQSQ